MLKKLKEKLIKGNTYKRYFSILFIVSFITASYQSFSNIYSYVLFVTLFILISAKSLIKENLYLKKIIILFIISMSIDMIVVSNTFNASEHSLSEPKYLQNEFESMVNSCEKDKNCDKNFLNSSYEEYKFYHSGLLLQKTLDNKVAYIIKIIPKIYLNLQNSNAAIENNLLFLDFYVNDLAYIIESEIKNNDTFKLKNLNGGNSNDIEKFSKILRIFYERQSRNISNNYLKEKINIIMKSI